MNNGRVIGVDIDIRRHNRLAVESHELSELITLIEDDSISESTLQRIQDIISPVESVMVILDSNHSYDHVINELKLYSQIVTKDSYIVVTDGSQSYLNSTPRSRIDYPGYAETWEYNNPLKAVEDFSKNNSDFRIVEPGFTFNEGLIDFRVTYWPSCYLLKVN